MRTLQLGKDKKSNIFADSRYGFHALYVPAAIWKERGMLTARTPHKTEGFDSWSFRSSAASDPGSNNPLWRPSEGCIFCEPTEEQTWSCCKTGHSSAGTWTCYGSSDWPPWTLPSPSIPHRKKEMLKNVAMKREAQPGIKKRISV